MGSMKTAILGAGPSGLTLARLLQQNNAPCVVYEAEPDRYSRNQGGSLDLHPQAGQLALREAGLMTDFLEIARPEGECMKVIDKYGQVLFDENVSGARRPPDLSNRPEVERTALRDLLLDSLEPDTVRWSHKVQRIEAEYDNKYAICFADGTKDTGIDLVVGADGGFSKTRHLVTDVQPHYSGVTIVELWAYDIDSKKPWLAQHIGAGSNFMFDEGRALLCQRSNNHDVRSYAGLRVPHQWADEVKIDWDNHAAVRQMLVTEYFHDCGEDVKRTILESDDHLVLRRLYMLPIGLQWESRAGVTLLGDAAHLMTPFAGVGVNAAMLDALGLARALLAHKGDLSGEGAAAAIREYESEMFPRGHKFQEMTFQGMQHHFSATGGQEWAEKFRAFLKHQTPCQDKPNVEIVVQA